ncbi:MAG: sulfur oxidation c-type cytochrome SoxX [Betaproteobacteria bacterium]|nr:sulfur oxidation c-type cytochrome SoxX [Betaproteobacteria bacterium]
MKLKILAVAAIALLAAGCASVSEQETAKKALEVMKTSFKERGQAKLDRLDQDDAQRLCSQPPSAAIAKETGERIEKSNFTAIKYPADGKILGDWREGEKIAQSGIGKQYSDDPKRPSGGNCYACHQLRKEEISFGTMGPSLYNYGKLRGTSEAIQRYTWGKIWNAQAFTACSNMPRFGHNGILTEQQIRHVAALLLDPNSPVNK